VTVYAFEIRAIRRPDKPPAERSDGIHGPKGRPPGSRGDVIDLDVSVVCSSGTYIRALARDLGARLGVGGHLTALRRTRVGPYSIDAAHTLDELAEELAVLPLGDAAAAAFPRRDLDGADAERIAHGVRVPAAGIVGVYAAFGPDGTFLALLEDHGPVAKPVAVFVG
jgi:tRNA pseudouridine55 synthase